MTGQWATRSDALCVAANSCTANLVVVIKPLAWRQVDNELKQVSLVVRQSSLSNVAPWDSVKGFNDIPTTYGAELDDDPPAYLHQHLHDDQGGARCRLSMAMMVVTMVMAMMAMMAMMRNPDIDPCGLGTARCRLHPSQRRLPRLCSVDRNHGPLGQRSLRARRGCDRLERTRRQRFRIWR